MSRDNPECLSYRPSAYYFRKALRKAKSVEDAREVGFQAVLEMEALKEWVRERGLIPPRRFILREEAEDKHIEFTLLSESLPDPDPAGT